MLYKVVQIWPRLFVCKQVTVCPGHIWTTLYKVHDKLKLTTIKHNITFISITQTEQASQAMK
jgi:hypothetical protein